MAGDRIVLTRRRFIGTSVSTAAVTMAGGIAKPYLSRAADRPIITHGLQSGDVGTESGVVWARTDRPARMQVEIATTDSFRTIRHGVFADTYAKENATFSGIRQLIDHGFPDPLRAFSEACHEELKMH
jgi:alkaline phosphatase D